MYKSVKQQLLEQRILKLLSGKALKTAEWLFANPELQAAQEYANIVSIKRLGYNDHGPVHTRKATFNAIKMFKLLNQAEIKMNLEKDGAAPDDDSLTAVILA